jgi:hypothetical protein
MTEIIGKFVVHNGKIITPPGAEGEYILKFNSKTGVFSYTPTGEPTVKGDLTYEVYDPKTPDIKASFYNETQASDYKVRMEKFFKIPYRMQKVFSSGKKNKKIVEGE